MGEINWTNEAETWLREIFEYIAQDNAEAAMAAVKGIVNQVEILRVFPEAGYRYWPKSEVTGEVRILLYGHYRIAYLVNPDKDIDVLGVFHGALDIDRHL